MISIDTHFIEIGLMDRLASRDTPIHRLDSRTKLLTTLIFIATVISFGKYEISALIPFFLYPIVLIMIGELPVIHLLKKIILVVPFAIMVGVFNPVLDKEPLLSLGIITISGGWVSFISILIRFVLTVGAAFILFACSGINGVCLALEKLGTPSAFTTQLLFLYRYLFVLMDEGMRMVRARAIRSFDKRGMGIKIYAHMLGYLLLRALKRAQHIHSAMICRGFNGHIKTMKSQKLKISDIAFITGWAFLFLLMRFYNVSHILGSLLKEIVS